MASRAERVRSARRSRGVSIAERLDRGFKYWALVPAVLVLLALTVHPAFNLLWMSVSTIEFVEGAEVWAFTPGRNFELLLGDWVFRTALWNTLLFVIAAVAAEMVLGFAVALLVSRLSGAKGIVRTLMVLPILVPPVAIGSMWKLMYNFEFGVFNQALMATGLPPVSWLGSVDYALWSIVVVDIWHWTPFVFLILLAGVEALPVDVLEAARVDGANRWQMLFRIIIPLMWPALSVALMFRTIFAFKVFDEVFLLTSGGPGTATEVVALYIYKVFFTQNQLGYGALLSVAVILAISVFIFSYRRFARLRGEA
jgi:multiple sugar transport system permease protein